MHTIRPVLCLLLFSIFPILSAQETNEFTGTLIVVNKSGDNASFIDLGSGEIIATLPTGRGPHELIITDDGYWAIATDYSGGNSLTVFDVENLRVDRTIDLSEFPRPHGIQLLPDQSRVLVTSEGSRQLVLVNFRTGEITRSISTGANASHMVALSADGTVAYTSNGGTNSVSVIDVTNGQQTKVITVPQRPEAITTNKSGDEIWVGSNDDEVVSVIAARDSSTLARWSGFDWPYRILLTDDERYAVIPDLGNESLRFFDARSKLELGSISLSGTRPQGVTLYPDDRTVLLSLSGANKVLAISIETRRILREYITGQGPDGIAYSPLVLRKNFDYQR